MKQINNRICNYCININDCNKDNIFDCNHYNEVSSLLYEDRTYNIDSAPKEKKLKKEPVTKRQIIYSSFFPCYTNILKSYKTIEQRWNERNLGDHTINPDTGLSINYDNNYPY